MQTALRAGKPNNRAFGAWEIHPYPRLRRYFPRRGKSSLPSASELISISRHKAAKTSPSGGGAVGRRGEFPSNVARFACFLFALRARFCGFIIRGGLHHLKGRPTLPPKAALGSFPRKELPDRAEEHRVMHFILMSQIRPLRGLGLSKKGLLSSVAYGVHSKHELH